MEIRSCRACGGKALEDVLDLGSVSANSFPLPDDPPPQKLRLSLKFCLGCGLAQSGHNHPPDLFFRDYWYQSGITQTMKMALLEIAEEGLLTSQALPGDLWIDIGSNDGTLLSLLPSYIDKIGFEPAKNLRETAEEKIPSAQIVSDYFTLANLRGLTSRRAKVITAIACMYSIPDINGFLEDVKWALSEDGVFIAQLTGLKHTLENNDIGNLTPEHVHFFSLTTLEALLKKHGLYVFDYKENSVNGGSIRVYASAKKRYATNWRVLKGKLEERGLGLHTPQPYVEFAIRAKKIKQSVQEWLNGEERPFGLGASTKFNLMADFWGINRENLLGVSERDQRKWGRQMVCGVPIISEQESREKASAFLVPIFGFRDELIKREREAGFKGDLFFPLPNPEVLKCE